MTEPKRRQIGEGSIRLKGAGWEVRYRKRARPVRGHNGPTQVARWKRSGAVPRAVRDALRELIREVEQGTETSARRLAFATYVADMWLPHHSTQVRVSTFKRDEELLRLHILPTIGPLRLSALRPLHVQRVLDGVAGKALSPGTQTLVYRVLSSSLGQALRWQLIAINPAKAVRPPRVERPMLDVPDRDQIAQILDASRGTWIEQPVLLAASTGMRLGETLALRWRDVDFETGVVRVTRAVEWSGRNFTFAQPKSSRSRRTINLPQFAIDALRRWRKDQNERHLMAGQEWLDLDLVVDDGVGGPHRTDSVSAAFRALMRRENIEPRPRFHDLRHGYATRLLEAGVHPKVVSEALGHASVSFTMDRYQHVMPTMQAQAADAIQAALGPR